MEGRSNQLLYDLTRTGPCMYLLHQIFQNRLYHLFHPQCEDCLPKPLFPMSPLMRGSHRQEPQEPVRHNHHTSHVLCYIAETAFRIVESRPAEIDSRRFLDSEARATQIVRRQHQTT